MQTHYKAIELGHFLSQFLTQYSKLNAISIFDAFYRSLQFLSHLGHSSLKLALSQASNRFPNPLLGFGALLASDGRPIDNTTLSSAQKRPLIMKSVIHNLLITAIRVKPFDTEYTECDSGVHLIQFSMSLCCDIIVN